MMKDRFSKVMLVIVAVLLLLNLLSTQIFSFLAPEAVAEYKPIKQQKVTFRGNGIGIACSNDGKYVYAAGSGVVFRSTDYGKMGSWEQVID
jgi:hypothetical protein